MQSEKEVLRNTVQKLAERAEDCFDRAKIQHTSAVKQNSSADAQHRSADAQHRSADAQRVSADKLVTLGVALEADAVELNGKLEMVAGRNNPQLEEIDNRTSAIPTAIPN